MSKVPGALFSNFRSLLFLPLSPLWCNFQSKTGTEPLTSSFPGPLYKMVVLERGVYIGGLDAIPLSEAVARNSLSVLASETDQVSPL